MTIGLRVTGHPAGGVLGPLTGNGAKTFRSVPPCPGPG
jgi:hypothetical protein